MPRHVFIASLLWALLAACQNEPAPPTEVEGSVPTTEALSVVRITGIPDENPTELARKFAPMVAYLSERLKAKVEYIPVTDYGAAVQALAAGRTDFVWLGGFTHVQARNMADVVPLVMRDIDRKFETVIIVAADSGIEKVTDVAGKTFAFGSKSSTSGHLMPRHFLSTEHGIDAAHDFKGAPIFSGAHDATAKLVETGRVAAGALNKQVWQRLVREGGVDTKRVRVIWTTPPYVDYVWTARTAVAPELRQRFIDAFVALDASRPRDKEVLSLQGAQGFVTAKSTDFDALEEVALSTGLLKRKRL